MILDGQKYTEVNASLITRYLRSLGWVTRTFNNGMRQLTHDDGHIEVFLSQGATEEIQREEAYFAIRTISDYYAEKAEVVERKILSYLTDRISGRIPDEYVRNDTIEFKVASEYMSQMKAFLSSSASTEISGKQHFERTLKEASEYAERCRFGHTFRGSFGFVVASPVEPNESPNLDIVDEAAPLGRRVVERIARGLETVQNASKNDDPEMISGVDSGFSSNMCDALANLVEETQVSRIAFGIEFSREWKRAASTEEVKFEVAQSNVELLRAAAKSMRIEEDPEPQTVFGRIRRVSTDGNPSNLDGDSAKREVEINWVNQDDKLVHVKLSVSPDEYLRAVEAHKAGQPVSAAGLLTTKGKTRLLTEIRDFKLLEI